MIAPPRWTEAELEAQLAKAREVFRQERMQEPLEQYLARFDQYQGIVEDLLETTIDASKLSDSALAALTDPKLLHAFRYLAGPPISEATLKVLPQALLSPSPPPNYQ